MTRLQMRSLRPGDIVLDHAGEPWVITVRIGEYAIAVRTVQVAQPDEWTLIASTTPTPRSGPREA